MNPIRKLRKVDLYTTSTTRGEANDLTQEQLAVVEKMVISVCVIIRAQQDRGLALHQQFIQLIGERFAVILTQGRLTTRIHAAIAQSFHEIAHA